MNKPIKSLQSFIIFLTALLFVQCGSTDSTAPTGKIAPETGSTLKLTDAIVVTFSESMKTDSLALGGSLASQSDGGKWSKTSVNNDTLTIKPKSSTWTAGPGDITIDATDTSKNAVAKISASYSVIVVFETFQAASAVIGQSDFISKSANQGGTVSSDTLNAPVGEPVFPGSSMYLPDSNNNRVLYFSVAPSASKPIADAALGQTSLTTNLAGTTSTTLSRPTRMATDGTKLIAADTNNNRVLIWNSIPTTSGTAADVVLGQPDFVTNTPAAQQNKLSAPNGVAVGGGKLIVADASNNRVLIWNSIPAASSTNADLVLGQTNFTTGTAGTTSATSLRTPTGVWTDGSTLIVADTGNNRVLIWNSIPTSNATAADVVIGQPGFVSTTAGTSDRRFSQPNGVYSNGAQLFVADTNNNRVLIYNKFPTTNEAAADLVLGQNNFSHIAADDFDQDGAPDPTPNDATLNFPTGVALSGSRLYVTSQNGHRVLIYEGQ